MRLLAPAIVIVLLGIAPSAAQVTDERSFVVRSDSSGSVNDCSLRSRSNENSTDDALTFRARPRSQQITVWVDRTLEITPADDVDGTTDCLVWLAMHHSITQDRASARSVIERYGDPRSSPCSNRAADHRSSSRTNALQIAPCSSTRAWIVPRWTPPTSSSTR